MQVVEHELKESTLYKLEKASVSHCWSRMKNEVLRSIGGKFTLNQRSRWICKGVPSHFLILFFM